ncbi:MAG TPA: glycosyltransferase [Kiritimatiellia bacterium]|nr:glycosyltransferase [Kiritimatiellia bacterium]HQG74596.1 glycosyltransferase [Kiritimatiellia bacterium]HQK44333.1 glycosyltransferase [Kiritimatiellia bacterium]
MVADAQFAAALYSAAPWANRTGAPICALEHLVALRGHFSSVYLVLPEHGPLEKLAVEAELPVWVSPLVYKGLRQGGFSRFWRGIGPVLRSRWQYVRGLVRQLRSQPGILHIHSRTTHLPYALLAGLLARVPVVVTIHEPWTRGFEAWLDVLLIHWLADRVILVSQNMADDYPRFLRRRAAISYNFSPVPVLLTRPESHSPLRIGMLARMGHRKGADIFLATCRLLRERGIPCEAWVAGGWNSEAEQKVAADYIAAHQLQSVVRDLGLVEDMPVLYRQLDVLFLPARRDPLPRVVMEAMCHGLPVVASRVDGIPEMVVDGETGILVEPENVEGFAEALARLLADPELRHRMGTAGHARAQEIFTIEAYRDAMMNVYKGLLPTAP